MSLLKLLTAIKGGSGSGNFGHAGRPGAVGGSASGSGNTFVVKDGPVAVTNDMPGYVSKLLQASGIDGIDVIIQTKKPSAATGNYRHGYYNDDEKKIVIFDYSTDYKTKKHVKLTDDQKAWVLAHELGHADHYAKGMDIPHKPDRERYAEAYATDLIGKVMPESLRSLQKWRKQVFDPANARYLD